MIRLISAHDRLWYAWNEWIRAAAPDRAAVALTDRMGPRSKCAGAGKARPRDARHTVTGILLNLKVVDRTAQSEWEVRAPLRHGVVRSTVRKQGTMTHVRTVTRTASASVPV